MSTTIIRNSTDILNAIRNSASINYQEYVPVAEADASNIRELGAIITSLPAVENEFLSLINRIAFSYITSSMYENPWSFFKKGRVDLGFSTEEIFVDLAQIHNYNPEEAQTTLYARSLPDVKTAFHVVNYQKYYDVTVDEKRLEAAFTDRNGVYGLIRYIIDSMFKSASYDEYCVMKYMIAKRILNGMLKVVTIPEVSSANMKAITSVIKGISNNLTFLTPNYNPSGVHNATEHNRQYVILDTQFDAQNDVEVLASAFNMDKADFMGRRVLIDGFGNLDTERLSKIFEGDSTYEELSQTELDALNTIPAILVDEEFFQIWDKLMDMRTADNGKGLYNNYFLHTWKIMGMSPFANAVAFIPATPSVTAVSVTPSAVSLAQGKSTTLTATVTATNFAPESVGWTSNNADVAVSASGVVQVSPTATKGTATITATSTFDSAKKATCTVTIS